jgi:DNA-binding CsgD family transcriptional regulator
MSEETESAILFSQHTLARALAVRLEGLNWRIRTGAAAPGSPVVVTEDDHGILPLHDITVPRATRLILVGGLNCLGQLARAVLRPNTSAVNADLPFGVLVRQVSELLRASCVPHGLTQQLQAGLSQRQAEAERFCQLTDREAAVLADLACGLSAADIARRRPVSLATARSQIAAILRKLQVPSQTAAVALAYRSCADHRVTAALRSHQNYG